MRKARLLITIALTLLALAAFSSCATAASKSAKVTDSKIKLYKSCSTSCKNYVTLSKGATIKIHDVNGKWAKASYGNKKGYVLKSGVTLSSSGSSIQSKSSSSSSDPVSGWAEKTLTVYKKASTSGGSYGKISRGTKVSVYDTKGSWAKVKVNGKNGYVKVSGLSKTQVKAASSSSVKAPDWFDSGIASTFYKGRTVTVTDVSTGISFKATRVGGTNHADSTPASKSNTEKMKKIFGGSWSWNRRAIWVTIGGTRYAASMNGMPHGGKNGVDNGFGGHFCIHFKNSRTHGSNKLDAAHQAMVKKAAK